MGSFWGRCEIFGKKSEFLSKIYAKIRNFAKTEKIHAFFDTKNAKIYAILKFKKQRIKIYV